MLVTLENRVYPSKYALCLRIVVVYRGLASLPIFFRLVSLGWSKDNINASDATLKIVGKNTTLIDNELMMYLQQNRRRAIWNMPCYADEMKTTGQMT